MAIQARHQPVLLDQVVSFLTAGLPSDRTAWGLDCTLGSAGHSTALLRANKQLMLLGLDRDADALVRSSEYLLPYADRVQTLKGNFGDISDLRERPELQTPFFNELRGKGFLFDLVLVDLGVSSDQLEDGERGFSFMRNGPLDMRMDRASSLSAEVVVNSYPPPDLARVFRRGGVGEFSLSLAREVVRSRPVHDCAHLASICEAVIGRVRRKQKRQEGVQRKHPATVPFQAIRIEVNKELDAVTGFLDVIPEYMQLGGRLAMISFHSLEDKLVASRMRKWERPEPLPRGIPAEAKPGLGRLLTKKAVQPSQCETDTNARARSALLRVFEFQR